MNMTKVTETLYEHGVSHTMIAPHVIRVTWLVDGASQPVIDFDAKHNFIRKLERFNAMRGVDKGKLRVVMDSCRFKNVN